MQTVPVRQRFASPLFLISYNCEIPMNSKGQIVIKLPRQGELWESFEIRNRTKRARIVTYDAYPTISLKALLLCEDSTLDYVSFIALLR